MCNARPITAALFLCLTFSLPAPAADPGSTWTMVADPSAAGWSSEALEAARTRAESIGSAAVLVVDSGRVVAAWGDVDRRFRSASLRKSLISALYGPAIERKQVDLSATLADLGIDDIAGLTEREKKATLRDLLASRSGVYLPAAKTTTSQEKARPARGSHEAGAHWFYNNWGFNVAGVVLAAATKTDPGELFLQQIARPVGMQDFRARDFYWEPEPRISRHPAFDVRVSARDLARLGQLYLNRGKWNGARVLPESWIDESVSIVTPFGDGSGYGYMWWINPERSSQFGLDGGGTPELSTTFAAEGAGAQILFVHPAKKLVIVHRGDTDNGRGVDEREALLLIAQIVRARTGKGGAGAKVELRELHATPFPGAKPAPPELEPIELSRESIGEFVGFYDVSPELSVELFEDGGRLFASASGRSEIQLFAQARDRLFSRSVALRIEVERDTRGNITALNAVLQGRPMRAVRRPAAPVEAPRGAAAAHSE